MSNTAYSDLKAAWHQDKIRALREGQQIVPAQVQLIISDLCNHDCHFCAYRMSGGFSTEQFGEDTGKGFTMNPNRRIPTKKAWEILDDCAELGVKAIQFTGGGEPTVHPDHLDLFRHAQSLGMKTGLVSNGYILKPGWEDVYTEMDWVRISVDAGSPSTYALIRNVSHNAYYRTMANIRKIADAIRKAESPCLLGVGFVVTPENYLEIRDGIAALSETGAAYVRLSAMFSREGSKPYRGIYENIKYQIEKAKELYDSDEFRVVDLFGLRIEDLDQGAPDYSFCGYQQFNCYIGGNLKVYRCCTTSYTAHGEVGDLTKRSFADWFRSEGKFTLYDQFDARSCHTCQFNDKNKVINYMLDTEPLHVEFV